MIEIKSRYDGAVIYRSETATTIKEAVEEAVKCGANLSGAYLDGAKISDKITLTLTDCDAPLHLTTVGNLGKYWLIIFGPYAKIGCHVKRIEDWLNYKTKSLTEAEMEPYKSFLRWVLEYRKTCNVLECGWNREHKCFSDNIECE